MAKANFRKKIGDLLQHCEWDQARQLLEGEREKDPENHWLLTQLGVTFYEQKKYEEALKLFLESRTIVDDCPLTLWNLAGTLDALGNYSAAMRIYTWLLESKKSPKDDPCWESEAWADSLKTDCVYRLGVCFQHLNKKRKAEHCFRQYLNLLLSGGDGTYSTEDVTRRIRGLHDSNQQGSLKGELQKAVKSTLQGVSASRTTRDRPSAPPRFDERELLSGRRIASKH